MILQALLAYAERDQLGDADFESVGVRWLISLTCEGRYRGGLLPLLDDPAAKKPRPKTLIRPFTSPNDLTQTGDKARAYFLCDTLERATLYLDPKTPEKHENRRAQHRYFRGLLSAAALATPPAAESLRAVLDFLDNAAALAALHIDLAAAKAKPNENVTFSVDGVDLLTLPSLQAFWRRRRRDETGKAAANREVRVCIATGEAAPTLDTTEKIKGIPGGLGQGTNLISFDKSAFCSYGLEQAQNSPLSPAAELKIRTALNTLVQTARDQRLVFNDTVYLHWARDPIVETHDPLNLLTGADSDAVRHLLDSVRSGTRELRFDDNLYYCLGLSGNGARIVVRDWLESTVGRVQDSVASWFADSEIIDSDGVTPRCGHKFGAILYAMVRAELDELPPTLPATLFYAILRGSTLPRSVLSAALRRQSLDQRKPDDPRDPRLNPARLGLIRAVLNRLPNKTNPMTAQLDPACSDSAYLCGRLFAVFDRLQYLAQGQLNAGIAERYYASACVTPALVMGRLFRNAQFHLAKAGGGIAGNIRKDFETISAALGCEFPPTLTLEAQGRFALGFYHQKADYRRISAESRAEREVTAVANPTSA